MHTKYRRYSKLQCLVTSTTKNSSLIRTALLPLRPALRRHSSHSHTWICTKPISSNIDAGQLIKAVSFVLKLTFCAKPYNPATQPGTRIKYSLICHDYLAHHYIHKNTEHAQASCVFKLIAVQQPTCSFLYAPKLSLHGWKVPLELPVCYRPKQGQCRPCMARSFL